MALAHSPNIVTDGLVFAYDMANDKKSWKGKPTVNMSGNGDFSGGYGIENESGSYGNNFIIEFANPGHSPYVLRQGPGGGEYEVHPKSGTSLQSNVTYCMSIWVAYTSDWNGDGTTLHSRWYDGNGNPYTTSGGGTLYETKKVGNLTWERRYQTFTTPSTISGTHNWYLGYPTNNTNGYRYITDVQLEVGSFPTPFIDGERSNTQALLDLTGNNTITANSLTYNSDGTFSFGSYGVANTTFTQFNLKSLNVWFYNNYIIPNNDTAIGGIITSYQCLIGFNNVSTQGINLGGWTSGATNEAIHFWTNTSTSAGYNGMTYTNESVPIGWHNLQINWNESSSIYEIWIDGSKKQTYSHSGLGNAKLQPITSVNVGGCVTDNYFFVGKIPIVQIYNRALTDQEVKQNFNAIRGRYGI